MKTKPVFVVAILLGTLMGQPALAAEASASAALHVQVNVPLSWQMWLDDEVADALTDRVREVFRRQGFDGRVERVDALDEPSADVPRLAIDLFEWRISHIGNIECTFTASLQTVRGVRQFGVYTNTSMRWMHGPGRFGLGESFEEAAEGAIRQLADDIAESEMLPGLRSG